MSDALHTVELSSRRVFEIHQDELDQDGPRKDRDNLGELITWHRRYSLGDMDGNDICPPVEFKPEERWPGGVWLPVYLLDHSGLTIRTRSFSDVDPGEWDSGQVGWIGVSLEKMKTDGPCGRDEKTGNLFPLDEPALRERSLELLRGEIKELDQYLTGDVYGFCLVKLSKCNHGTVHRDVVDSVWGFYGHDWKENGILEHLSARDRRKVEKALC